MKNKISLLAFSTVYINLYHQITQYEFVLHPSLRLNLSLHHLYVSAYIDLNCSNGYISIQSNLNKGNRNHTAKDELKYCGKYALVSSYPKGRLVVVRAIVRKEKRFGYIHSDLRFSVIDPNRLFTDVYHRNPSYKLWLFCFGPHHSHVEMYKVQVLHFQIVQFSKKSGELHLQIHDGAGARSKLLKCSGSTQNQTDCTTSSFQAFLSVWQQGRHRTTIMYTGLVAGQKSVISSESQSSFHLPNSFLCPSVTLCVISLSGKPVEKVNLTLTQFRYHGDWDTDACGYAGAAVYDVMWNVHELFTVECVTLNIPYISRHYASHASRNPYRYTRKGINYHRSIVSKNSELLLIFYFHKEYGDMSLSVQFGPLDCIVMNLNFCAIHVKQKGLRWVPLCQDFQIATHFISELGKSWRRQCFVIQYRYHDHRRCATDVDQFLYLRMQIVNTNMFGRTAHIFGSGFAAGQEHIVVVKTKTQNNHGPVNALPVQGFSRT